VKPLLCGLLIVAALLACTSATAPVETVASVSIASPKSELTVGQQLQLAATPVNATGGAISGRTAVWTSSSESVAKVSEKGLVTGISPGVVIITAITGEATGFLSLKILPVPIATLTITPLQSPVAAATQVALQAIARDSIGAALTGRTFSWTTSDSAIARVSQDGVVTGLAPGAVTITASQGAKSATTTVNVVAGVTTSIVISNTGRVWVQGARQLTFIARDVLGNVSSNPLVSWTSSDASAVSVTTSGVLFGLKPGSDVRVTAASGTASSTTTTRALAVTSVGTGDEHSCALTDLGDVECWGVNASGELGAGAFGSDTSFVPLAVAGGIRFGSLGVGASHSCALTSNGTAYCWGAGDQGQLGNGSRASRLTPVQVSTTVRFSQIAPGRYHTCALTDSGDVYCWGGGSFGLGITPTKVPLAVPLTVIASGENQSCGLDASGILYCWNVFPGGSVQPLGSDVRFVALSITRGTKCALTADGKVYCWGNNQFMKISTPTPVELVTPLRFSAIATAVDRLCGISIGGTTTPNAPYCIGIGSSGELGDGERHTTATTSFVAVSPGVSNVTQVARISTGLFSTCAATPAGTPYCWGLGKVIGIGVSATQFSPYFVAPPQ